MQKILTLKAFYTNVKLQQTHLSWTIIISHAVLVFFYTPWKWSLMGYIGITLSIRPSVCEKFVSGPYFFWGGGAEKLEVLTSHKDCWRPKSVSWPSLRVILARSKSLAGKVQNLCPVCIFLIEKNLKFLLDTKITYYLRVTLTQGH